MDHRSADRNVVVPLNCDRTNVSVQLVESDSGRSTGGFQLVNPERTTKVSDPTDLIELARQVQKGDELVRARAVGRLEIIAEQIRHLQEQAKRVLEEARRDDALHHAACNFKRVPGHVYHLYRRPSGQKYFSMIAPQEWGAACPHTFLGAFRLEADMSWTPADKADGRRREIELMDQILNAHNAYGATPVLEFTGPVPAAAIGAETETHPFDGANEESEQCD